MPLKNLPVLPPQAGTPEVENPLPVKVISGINMPALVYNIMSGLLVFVIVASVMMIIKKTSPFFVIAVPLIVLWLCIMATWKNCWVTVDKQKGKVFVDMIVFPTTVRVFLQGGHFVNWSSKKQEDDWDFQKWREIAATTQKSDAIAFKTKNGFDAIADVVIFFQYKDDADSLSRSLRFRPEELAAQIRAFVAANISDVGGQNDYDDLLDDKPALTAFIAKLFCGEGTCSEFESKRGIRIKDPALVRIGLSPESEEIRRQRAAAGILSGVTDDFLNKRDGNNEGLTLREAIEVAKVATGRAKEEIKTYKGVPQGAKVVALGDSGIALASK